MALHWYW